MNLKSNKVQKYWGNQPIKIDYSQMDQSIISKFNGTHPKIIQDWLPSETGLYQVDPSYKLTNKQKKHQIMRVFEKIFGVDLCKKHYKLI